MSVTENNLPNYNAYVQHIQTPDPDDTVASIQDFYFFLIGYTVVFFGAPHYDLIKFGNQ